MKIFLRPFFFTLTLSLITYSIFIFEGCNRDEIIIASINSGQPSKSGVYVISEGAGLPNQSQFSFLSYETDFFNYNITFPDLLGIYPDGLINYKDFFYVTEQGTPGSLGKIYKIDTSGIILNSLNFGKNPYSIAAVNDKAYCTNGPDSSVSVIDLNTFTEIKRIKVGAFPQEIISINLQVIVCNTRNISLGIYDSTISVINANSDTETHRAKMNYAPSSLAQSRDGYLLVGSSGDNGIIYKVNVDNFTKVDSFVTNTAFVKDISVDYNSDDIYFISSPSTITRLNLTSRTQTNIISGASLQTATGYSFDWKSRKHYTADSRDYTSRGFLNKYSAAGVLESSFQTGIRPRRILIRN